LSAFRLIVRRIAAFGQQRKKRTLPRSRRLTLWPHTHGIKSLIHMVAGDGIEPPTRGFSRHNRETHVF
jgi:hypothetical protein